MKATVNDVERDAKHFPTAQVLSVVTDRVLCEQGFGAFYEILGWMTGEELYTHQLVRVAKEATAVLLALHPGLATACEEAALVDQTNWRSWLVNWEERYGATLLVPKLFGAEHEVKDALAELTEYFPPEQIIVVGSGS